MCLQKTGRLPPRCFLCTSRVTYRCLPWSAGNQTSAMLEQSTIFSQLLLCAWRHALSTFLQQWGLPVQNHWCVFWFKSRSCNLILLFAIDCFAHIHILAKWHIQFKVSDTFAKVIFQHKTPKWNQLVSKMVNLQAAWYVEETNNVSSSTYLAPQPSDGTVWSVLCISAENM